MVQKILSLVFMVFFLFGGSVYAQDKVDQAIEDFKVSGYNDEKDTSWELKGKDAHLKGDMLEVNEVKIKSRCKDLEMNVVSEKGYYNKSKGIVLLSHDVKAVSSNGTTLTTDQVVWDTKRHVLETDKPLTIEKMDKSARLQGVGGTVEIDKNTAMLHRNVRAEMDRSALSNEKKEKRHRTVIKCKGPLVVHYREKVAIFNNDVVVEDESATIYSDKLTVYFNSPKNRIRKIIAEGHVRIVKGDNVTESEKAVYDVENDSLTMIGEPKILFYTGEEIGKAYLGDKRFD